jgi:hypothetical protein
VQIPRRSQQPENKNSAKSGTNNFRISMLFFPTTVKNRRRQCLACHSLPGGRIDMVEVSAYVAGALKLIEPNRYFL